MLTALRTRSITPVFHVSDIDRAVAFYTRVLGFTEEFRFGGYVGLKLDGLALHLSLPGDHRRPVGGGSTYITCDAVDDYHQRILAQGGTPLTEPKDAYYGMRDFIVVDPDGNQLSFGCDIADNP
ncbi:MAG: VOC family protein [Verrucomicrobiota bacterium]